MKTASQIQNSQKGFVQVLLLVAVAVIAYVLVSGNGKDWISNLGINIGNQTTDSYIGWKSYHSKLGGFSLKYPSSWESQGFEGYIISFSENSDKISLYSKLPSKNAVNGDYMCVEFTINSIDDYALTKGEFVSTLDNGLKIYQVKENYAAKESVRAWLTDSKLRSLIRLPNGKKLLSHVEFNCVQGDLDQIRLTYSQQISSNEYQEALKILKSISL